MNYAPATTVSSHHGMSFTVTELRRRAVGYAFPELHVRTYIGVLPTEKRPELSPDFARAKQYQSLVYLVCLLLTYGCYHIWLRPRHVQEEVQATTTRKILEEIYCQKKTGAYKCLIGNIIRVYLLI